jgi:ubiquinone/menaquinone biosynthesis C-methylase UbiE
MTIDPYHITDQLEDAMLDVIVTRLEERGKHPFFEKMMHEYLEAMNIDSKDSVLDMGCGTGVAARAIARREGFSGSVVGIDLSSYLAQAAEGFASEEGLSDRTSFQVGDTRSLDIPDDRFDAIVAHTLVSHVDKPIKVVEEARRVVKPGGMVGIFDGDYASITFAQSDEEKGRQDDEALINAMITSPRVMRSMPRFIRDAGLELVASFPYVLTEVGTADFWVPAIESLRKLAPRSGAMTEDEAEAWADDQLKSSDEGIFFGSSNYYGYVARRP